MKKQEKGTFIEVFEKKGGNIDASCKAFGIKADGKHQRQ